MATATETNEAPIKTIDLTEIVSNTAQSRGMGVLYRLNELGYQIFTSEDETKPPIWQMLFSDKPEQVKEICRLLREHEEELVTFAEGMAVTGLLQPIGVVELPSDNGYDVVFGMRRALALAFNYAEDPKDAPSAIEVKVLPGDLDVVALKLMALEENGQREDESPIDKAMTYKFLATEGAMNNTEIGKKVGVSSQTIANHLKLLDKRLEDKRIAVHTGTLTLEKALKLWQKRKEDAKADTGEAPEKRGRTRSGFPGSKAIQKIYDGHRPKEMTEKEWEMVQVPEVRKWIAFRLGLKFKPYTPLKEEPKDDAAKNGQQPVKTIKVLSVKRERAIQLLISLGKTQARTWDDKKLSQQLENIVALVEEGQKAENASLQGLLEKLLEGYKEGSKVKILADAK